ncbi:hypothetical protein SEA_SPEEDDEMON_20 [Gordonia phage SpeedDemon]|nr:hypothetical protein SEA_SPEEDDEMON_20 [Gordonia phage SpeedDemon]
MGRRDVRDVTPLSERPELAGPLIDLERVDPMDVVRLAAEEFADDDAGFGEYVRYLLSNLDTPTGGPE